MNQTLYVKVLEAQEELNRESYFPRNLRAIELSPSFRENMSYLKEHGVSTKAAYSTPILRGAGFYWEIDIGSISKYPGVLSNAWDVFYRCVKFFGSAAILSSLILPRLKVAPENLDEFIVACSAAVMVFLPTETLFERIINHGRDLRRSMEEIVKRARIETYGKIYLIEGEL